METVMKWLNLEFQGRKVRIPALKAQGRLWFHWQGETHVVDINTSSRRNAQDKGKAHPGVISAPMPGKITRVSVKAGERVSQGQALVVMEAMKMEYTLEADRDGVVGEVNVQIGQQVALGQVLVRVGEK
jgi:acetyl/propionyl-CoA carboxylase alpha subunit